MTINWQRWLGAIALLALGFAAGAGFVGWRGMSRPAPVEIIPAPTAAPTMAAPAAKPEATPTPGPIRVYVSGAVANPAVYSLGAGSIIDDLVRAAGGFAPSADPAAVNLAQPLADGMQVHVPTLADALPTPPAVSAPAGARSSPVDVDLGGLVNINTATAAELEALPGVGPVTAAQIIAYREANGPFDTIEALMDVPGIGEGKFNEMKALIHVGP
jgi:competence protein ComEA